VDTHFDVTRDGLDIVGCRDVVVRHCTLVRHMLAPDGIGAWRLCKTNW